MKRDEIRELMTDAEKMVCDYINEIGLYWYYERPVYIEDDKLRPRLFNPDFYLPDIGVYVEVVAKPTLRDYERVQEIYEQNHVAIVFVAIQKKSWKEDLRKGLLAHHTMRDKCLSKLKRLHGEEVVAKPTWKKARKGSK